MVDFYQKVATPQTQFKQERAAGGPSVDANARAEAQNDSRNNIGTAIQSLLGVTQGVSNIVDKKISEDDARLAREHKLDIMADTQGFNSSVDTYIKAAAASEGKEFHELSNEELKTFTKSGTEDFIQSKGLAAKPYYGVMQKVIKDRQERGFQKHLELRDETNKQRKLQVFDKNIEQTISNFSNPQDSLAAMQDLIDTSVGYQEKTGVDEDGNEYTYMPEIQEDMDVMKMRALQKYVEAAIVKEDTQALSQMKSKEFKEYFKEIPDVDNAINVAQQNAQSIFNKNRQVSYTNVEDSIYSAIDMGAIRNTREALSAIDTQIDAFDEDHRPSTQDVLRLKQKIAKSMVEEEGFQHYYDSLKGGDFTVLERDPNLEKKEKDMIKNKFFSVETGLRDLSPEGITTAINSGSLDAPLKKYFSDGHPIPPDLEKWANTPPSGGIQGITKKYNTFLQLNRLTQDTNTSTFDIFSPKEYSRMMFIGRLSDNLEKKDAQGKVIDAGVMDENQALQVYSTFNNDLNKNVDSFGTFISTKASQALQDESVQEWLQEAKTDAPYTYDEFSSQAYMERQFKGYFSYAMETTDDLDEAKELASDMFYNRHRPFENPDGSEGVIPHEFNSLEVDDFVSIANNDPDQTLKAIRESSGYLNQFKDYAFESNLSFKPDPSYEKNKLMNLYYDNKFIKSYSAQDMQRNIQLIGKKNVSNAEDRNVSITQGR